MRSRKTIAGRGIFSALAASLFLSACSSQIAYIPREAPNRVQFLQAGKMNDQYSDMQDCTKWSETYEDKGWPKGTSLAVIEEIDRRVRERFVYGREVVDSWNPRADVMLLTDHRWVGDCDDLASTVVALARCAGVPDNRLGFSLVKANGSDTVNHMVGFYTDPYGRSYAIGDTFGRGPKPMLAHDQKHFSWAFLDDLDKWFAADEEELFDDPRKVRISVSPEERPS